MRLVRCGIYYAVTGFIFFLCGRMLPKKFFDPDAFPFRSLACERGGEIYEKIGVKHWQDRLPDMSKLFTNLMPAKSITRTPTSEQVRTMIRETCIAEFVHLLLYVVGLGAFRYFKAKTAVFIFIFYSAVNSLFVIVQRYNRPRLQRLLVSCRRRECRVAVGRQNALTAATDI